MKGTNSTEEIFLWPTTGAKNCSRDKGVGGGRLENVKTKETVTGVNSLNPEHHHHNHPFLC
jgi:hypothetical protein